MGDFVDFYEVLGLGEEGLSADAAALKKAYRRQALVHHPDKAKGGDAARAAAAAAFDRVQKAYDALCDGAARAAFDAVYRLKKEREVARQAHTAKRRRMLDELEAREAAAAREVNVEKQAAARLAAELARLRARREAEQKAGGVGGGVGATAAAQRPAAAGGGAVEQEDAGQTACTLKVTWLLSLGEYSAAALREALGAFGGVADVILLGARKKKGVAWVVLADEVAASRAAGAVAGRREAPLSISRHPEWRPSAAQPPPKPQAPAPAAVAPRAAAARKIAASATALGHRGYEDLVLQRMRQAAERKRLAKAMEAAEKAEEAADRDSKLA